MAMATSIDYYDLFNRKIHEFMDDLISICPPEMERQFTIFKDVLRWAIALHKTYPCEIFESTVIKPFEDHIRNRNEEFFLTESYTTYNEYYKNYYNDLNIVEQLKTVWKTLNPHNKNIVWQYFDVLVVLAQRTHTPAKN